MNVLLASVCLLVLGCDVKRVESTMIAQLYIGKTTYVNHCAVESACSMEAISICAPLEPFSMSWAQIPLGFTHEFICLENTHKALPDFTKD